MASQVLEKPEVRVSLPPIPIDSYTRRGMKASVRQGPALVAEMHNAPEQNVSRGNCARGIWIAISIEAVAAACIYGIWQLWHLLR